MTSEQPITELQRRNQARGTRRLALFWLICLIMAFGAIVAGSAVYMGSQLILTFGRSHPDIKDHFKYGSIGAELANGLPYRIFVALPKVFPEYFDLTPDEAKKLDAESAGSAYSKFGLIFESDDGAVNKGLPVGFATGQRMGQDVAWFNCAVCHTGRIIYPGEDKPRTVLGMPANTINLERLFLALFDMAVDKRFSWQDRTFREAVGEKDLWWSERLIWEWGIVPYTRAVLIRRRSELLPLLDPIRAKADLPPRTDLCQPFPKPSSTSYRSCGSLKLKEPAPHKPFYPNRPPTRWGPGRVDTFNPYKLIHFNVSATCLKQQERIGFTDFPSIFHQHPRGDKMMHLHWDGNNASLKERNLSAALGAGVTPETVRHRAVERVAEWLKDLAAPPSPYLANLDADEMARGKRIYMRECADCHGWRDDNGYVFEGDRLGKITPQAYVGTDTGRLDSYTAVMEKFQKDQLFCDEPEHRFRHFKKTTGYANMPLDGLWLRAPYLHNGSVPTLYDLLLPPDRRPAAFRRDSIRLDAKKGGFAAPPCAPGTGRISFGACFDTGDPGNSNAGHTYGTNLSDSERHDLLQYLLSF